MAEPGAESSSFLRLPGNMGDLAPLPDGRLLARLLADGRDRRSSVLAIIAPADMKVFRIHESSTAIHSPAYLGPRPRPPVRPRLVRGNDVGKPEATGFLYAQDVRITRKTKADWD